MRHALTLHPLTPCAAAIRVAVVVARPDPSSLILEFHVTGALDALSLPPPGAGGRAGGLWQHTCVEAFVQTPPGYCEFNVAPSTQWAAYRFDAYRDGMRPLEGIAPPRIVVERTAGRFTLRAGLQLPLDARGRIGLSAVIEETEGCKSYWALAHPPGKPDFHHADCFALELPAA